MGQLFHCFVAPCGGRTWRGDSAATWFLEVCQLSPSFLPISSNFIFSSYDTDDLPAIVLMLNPTVYGSVYVLSSCGPFKMSLLKIQQFLLLPQLPLVFIARNYGDLSSWSWNTGCVVWPVAGIPCSWGIPPDFYLPHMNVGPHFLMLLCTAPRLCASSPVSMDLPLLPVWMNVASFNPWLSEFHTAWFSDYSGWYLFCGLVVIFFCSCVRRWSVFTYASILTGNSI